MALVTISIPDEVYRKYASYNPDSPENGIVDQLKRFQEIKTGERVLVLSGSELSALERLKVGLSIENFGHLLAWIKGLITFQVGGLKFNLNEGQSKRLEQFARFWKRDPKLALEQVIANGLKKELGG